MPRARWQLGQPHNRTGRTVGRLPSPETESERSPELDPVVLTGEMRRGIRFQGVSGLAQQLAMGLVRQHLDDGGHDPHLIPDPMRLASYGLGPNALASAMAELIAVGLAKSAGGRIRLTWLANSDGTSSRNSRPTFRTLANVKAAAAEARRLAAMPRPSPEQARGGLGRSKAS